MSSMDMRILLNPLSHSAELCVVDLRGNHLNSMFDTLIRALEIALKIRGHIIWATINVTS